VQHACACALPVSPESFAGAFLDRSISYGAAMMILRSSPASPFGRKVRIAISLLGFDDQTRIEPPIRRMSLTACAGKIRSAKFQC
jgi:hypothetical protein